MDEQHTNDTPPVYTWLVAAKARGLEDALSLALDVLEPFGPLSAQCLWVLQPALGMVIARDALRDIANALETPGGVAALRQMLKSS